MDKSIVKIGAVVEFNGKYWGIQYQDTHSTHHHWGPIEYADIVDLVPDLNPKDFTYSSSPQIKALQKGTIVKLERTTTYKVTEIPDNEA